MIESRGVPPEVALDLLRTEGCWEPVDALPAPSPAKTGSPGRFVNRCDRCLRYVQSSRKDLSRSQRVWLCAECSGPNPPEVIIDKAENFHDMLKKMRATQKAEEKEKRKREREEAKARKLAMPRVRGSRGAKGKPKDPVG